MALTAATYSHPGGATHSTKVTTYAPPFRPPFFRCLENLYSFDPYILAKMRKMSYFDPYFSSKLGKMYSFDPPVVTLVAFRVYERWGAPLSEIWPSTPPGIVTHSASHCNTHTHTCVKQSWASEHGMLVVAGEILCDRFNSLASGRFEKKKIKIDKWFSSKFSDWWFGYLLWNCLLLWNCFRWMSLDLTFHTSTLMATGHCLDQCWPGSMLPSGVTMPQWVKKTILANIIMVNCKDGEHCGTDYKL